MIKKKFQIFADGEGGGAEGGDGAGTQQEPAESKTFDDLLKEGDYQAEFDRRVQKAISTAVANAEKKWRTLTDDKVSEAEKLAQMTAEQKELFSRYSDCVREFHALAECLLFQNSFKLGARMMIEVVEE